MVGAVLLLSLVPAPALAFVAPKVATGNALPEGATNSATVYGRVDYSYEAGYAACVFEYGTDITYSAGSVPCSQEEFYIEQPNDVFAKLSGLQSGVTYHYRIVATTAGGVEMGMDRTFTEEPAAAIPGLPINSFSLEPSTTQAGGHPDITTAFWWSEREKLNFPNPCFCEDAQDTTTHLPAGVIGNPHAAPYCTLAQLGIESCPPDTQVGWVLTEVIEDFGFSPVFNVEPDPDQAGLLGFEAPFSNTPALIELSSRTGGDYGLDATFKGIEQIIPPEASILTLWGVPAESSNDPWRAPLGFEAGRCLSYNPEPFQMGGRCFPPTASTSPRAPFLDNPTVCGEPLTASLEILAYDTGVSRLSTPYPASTGCDQLTFNPSLSGQPTTGATDTPSGLEIDLSVPQEVSPETPSPSEIRSATVKLPEGFSINANAGDGRTTCTDAEARLGTPDESQCPETSKVGTVSLDSSALPGPIPGYIYLLAPQPGDRYRILLSANGFATHVKLIGSVVPDPKTGQLTTSFADLPQSPLTDFNIHFFGSERGLLATPIRCGTYPVESVFTPWDASLPEQSSTQFFTLGSGPGGASCKVSSRTFTPSFQASSIDSTAGVHTPFSINLVRPDGDQNLVALNVKTPPGFSATLAGIPYCSDAALAAAAQPGYSGLEQKSNPSCPAASEVGTAQAGAGAGTNPVYLPGKVYLAGPYKGSPLSLAVITPAVSGSYDLGNVVVRAALNVNPQTAQVTAVSDQIPQVLEGIPLRLRSIRIDLSRPNFALNPTNCDPFSVNAEVFGSEGATATPTSHFQVANCRVLSFAPKLSVRLTGSTKQAGNPALTAILTTRPGEANISRTRVTLPNTELVDNAHINSPCTRVQFNEGLTPGEKCPSGSILGFAKADTPLLEKPLEGPVYLRSTGRAGLPDIVAALNGQIDIVLDGHVDSVRGGLRTTFETVPDAPISKFTLRLDGGNKGLIENSPRLCAHAQHVTVAMTGQNGKTANRTPILRTACGKNHERKRGMKHSRRAQR